MSYLGKSPAVIDLFSQCKSFSPNTAGRVILLSGPFHSHRDIFETAYSNRPFYRYGGHIELIPFNEYYRMPRGA